MILYYNAHSRSLIPKMNLPSYSPDVICITGKWLEGDTDDAEVFLVLDSYGHGEGVLMYIKDTFYHTLLPRPSGALELVSVCYSANK